MWLEGAGVGVHVTSKVYSGGLENEETMRPCQGDYGLGWHLEGTYLRGSLDWGVKRHPSPRIGHGPPKPPGSSRPGKKGTPDTQQVKEESCLGDVPKPLICREPW
jgi:hypothetical protein